MLKSERKNIVTREHLNIEQLRDCFTKFKVMRQKGNFHGEQYNEVCAELLRLLKIDSGVYDTFIAMFKNGPLDAGDLPSKGGRDILVAVDMCVSVISKASWHYALVGCLDVFWTYLCEQARIVSEAQLTKLREISEVLRDAMQKGKLTNLKLLLNKLGEAPPSNMVQHTIDFPDFINKLINKEPIGLATKLVLCYYREKTTNHYPPSGFVKSYEYFRDPKGKCRMPGVLIFMTTYAFKVLDDGYFVVRSKGNIGTLGDTLDFNQIMEYLKP